MYSSRKMSKSCSRRVLICNVLLSPIGTVFDGRKLGIKIPKDVITHIVSVSF